MVDWDLVLIAALAEEEEKSNQSRRFWVNNLWKQRYTSGEFNNLFNDLRYDVRKFYDYYRMSYENFESLVHLLRPFMEKKQSNFRTPISVEERLSVCLRFLITGVSFKTLAFNYRMGFSTVRCIVHETCRVIWNILGRIVLPKPTTAQWKIIAKDFDEIWNFPNCIGAIDGKHFKIRAPNNSGSMYFNYKKFFSIVLLAVADAKYRFVIVDVGAYGRNSDGGILDHSKLGLKLQNDTLNIPQNVSLRGITEELPYVFVADEAFPLTKNIMRPYPANQLANIEKRVFNYRLSRARRIVESAFGILQSRFEIFQRRMQVQAKYIDNIILACCSLHNYIINNATTELPNPLQESDILESSVDNNVVGDTDIIMCEGMVIRYQFKQYFNSEHGSVSWQNNIVNRS
ncbi:protein ALP1-like isoform X1 [Pararge aegeria]|uniref:protein ALP1-like isoform X1 n=1 Tax=Pararge aegeria TaxID=116150 RepID=UPI0019D30284|nr:protein ALP1-like isoform X1 [Pararge aegeria]